jgi:predicted DNA-binding transcriptional regulator AlpA
MGAVNLDKLTRDELIALMVGAQSRLIAMSAPAAVAPAAITDSQHLTQKDLACRLQVSLPTLWRMRKRADFPRAVRVGARARWRESDILNWEKAQNGQGAAMSASKA